MTYNLCKTVITNKTYQSADEMTDMLDVFLLNKRITVDQYTELTTILKEQNPEPPK